MLFELSKQKGRGGGTNFKIQIEILTERGYKTNIKWERKRYPGKSF